MTSAQCIDLMARDSSSLGSLASVLQKTLCSSISAGYTTKTETLARTIEASTKNLASRSSHVTQVNDIVGNMEFKVQ